MTVGFARPKHVDSTRGGSDVQPSFPVRPVRDGFYYTRQERQIYLMSRFRDYLSGGFLDVGCSEAPLRGQLPGYVGVDIVGRPDVRVDLELGGLPFIDRSFPAVVCLETLEHLSTAHRVIRELFRVADRYLFISLPNEYIITQRFAVMCGRPLQKGVGYYPRNHHKWIASYSQAQEFVHRAAQECGFDVVEEFPYVPFRRLRFLRSILAMSPGLFASSYWVVLQRHENSAR